MLELIGYLMLAAILAVLFHKAPRTFNRSGGLSSMKFPEPGWAFSAVAAVAAAAIAGGY